MLQPVERRKGERYTILADAKVYCRGEFVADVKVTDLSHKGARIQTQSLTSLPARFHLVLSDGRQTIVDYLWRIDDQVGLLFREPLRQASAMEARSVFS